MNKVPKLNNPLLVAVWPGMGHVGVTAAYYLLSKLDMHLLAEFWPRGLFEVDHVEVKAGLIHTGRLPRSRFFVWTDPQQKQDLVVFIGEAQPPLGKYPFCQKLIEFAQQLGVERVFTFAAMATTMQPDDKSRVFAAATDVASLSDLKRLEVEVLEDGSIGGLNGLMLGAAAEKGLHGYTLLGEMPQMFVQLPYPQASLAVLEAFKKFAGMELDLTELADQAHEIDEKLGEFLAQFEQAVGQEEPEEGESWKSSAESEEAENEPEVVQEKHLAADDEERIERLFAQAREKRSKAYELKNELDRLEVFKDYEDRFLDLFKKAA